METNKFYADFTGTSKTEIKVILEKNGWHNRKISWEDYEFKNNWSELILEGHEDEPLLNGVLIFNEENVHTIDKLLESLKGNFRYEIYDGQKIVLEKKTDFSL